MFMRLMLFQLMSTRPMHLHICSNHFELLLFFRIMNSSVFFVYNNNNYYIINNKSDKSKI
jgi:hypothetical protein